MRFLPLLLALVFAACGSSDKPSSTGPKKVASGKKIKKKKKPATDTVAEGTPTPEGDEPTEKVVKKKKKKPFEPAPLESLADRGALKVAKLGKPLSKIEKLCPKKASKKKAIACLCLPMGEASAQESWEGNPKSCSTPVEGLEAPLTNVQLLAVQQTTGAKDAPEISAQFDLMLQTKKGINAAKIGSASMSPGIGYGSTFSMKSRSFVDLVAGGNQELMVVFEQSTSTTADGGERTTEATGWLVVCSAADPKKIQCSEPVSLGASRGEEGGYLLEPLVEGNALYLRETTAKTPEELASAAGKYTLAL